MSPPGLDAKSIPPSTITTVDPDEISARLDSLTTLTELACVVLNEPNCDKKAALTQAGYRAYQDGKFRTVGSTQPPLVPARPSNVKIVDPGHMPSMGKAGSDTTRIKMLHALAHIESVAIDLSWDIIARFASPDLPEAFYKDWIIVADDEARHYSMLCNRLRTGYKSEYGDHPAHDGLWQSATETNGSLVDRLVVVHCVHEARGLDVTPKTINKFRGGGDKVSAEMLEVILSEEITHVTAGMRWFKHCIQQQQGNASREGSGEGCGEGSLSDGDVIAAFHGIVREHFHGPLKPPFNHAARKQAGMTEEWYMPLVKRQGDGKGAGQGKEEPKAVDKAVKSDTPVAT